jgi:hypothetical protein
MSLLYVKRLKLFGCASFSAQQKMRCVVCLRDKCQRMAGKKRADGPIISLFWPSFRSSIHRISPNRLHFTHQFVRILAGAHQFGVEKA